MTAVFGLTKGHIERARDDELIWQFAMRGAIQMTLILAPEPSASADHLRRRLGLQGPATGIGQPDPRRAHERRVGRQSDLRTARDDKGGLRGDHRTAFGVRDCTAAQSAPWSPLSVGTA